MPKFHLAPFPDGHENRRKVAEFLRRHWAADRTIDWEQRMRFWWDENPAAASISERGHWVCHEGRLACFGGAIPALYAYAGKPLPALYATTLCVDEALPKAAAALFLTQRQLSEQHVITHSTPNPRVQEALRKMGAHGETEVTRHFLPAGLAARLLLRSWSPALPPGRRLVTDPADVAALARPYQKADRIEKWMSPEYLRWFCQSPVRQHHFLGAIDAQGTLSSCLLATARQVKGLRAWDVIDAFTTNDDTEELHALIAALVRDPGLFPGGAALVTAASFAGDQAWEGVPALLRRRQQVCHFFLLPEPLRQMPKRTVMAEGDLGL